MLDLCQPCKEKGRFRAPYKIVKGVPMCGGCVADLEANPPEEAKPQALQFLEEVKNDKEQKASETMLDQATIDAIKADDGKLSLSEICEKHGVSWPTAKRYAPSAVSKKGKKPAGGGGSSPAPKRAAAKHAEKNGASRWSATISQLREERDRIDRVIVELEKMN